LCSLNLVESIKHVLSSTLHLHRNVSRNVCVPLIVFTRYVQPSYAPKQTRWPMDQTQSAPDNHKSLLLEGCRCRFYSDFVLIFYIRNLFCLKGYVAFYIWCLMKLMMYMYLYSICLSSLVWLYIWFNFRFSLTIS